MSYPVLMAHDSLESSIPGSNVSMVQAAADVIRERVRQVEKWGDDSHKDRADGTGLPSDQACAEFAKLITDTNDDAGTLTWRDILHEEVCEAFAETDPVKLRTELVQVAAVAVKWVEAIDRRADS